MQKVITIKSRQFDVKVGEYIYKDIFNYHGVHLAHLNGRIKTVFGVDATNVNKKSLTFKVENYTNAFNPVLVIPKELEGRISELEVQRYGDGGAIQFFNGIIYKFYPLDLADVMRLISLQHIDLDHARRQYVSELRYFCKLE